jgi:hypothetical protein
MRANPSRAVLALILAAGLAAGAASAADAPAPAASQPANAVRPEFAAPFNAAQELLKANKPQEALSKLKEAEAVGNLSPFEAYLVVRVRGPAEYAAGDLATAAKDFELVLASDKLPAADRPTIMKAQAEILYTDKQYGPAAAAIQRYLNAGGDDAQLRELLPQSYYLAKDYANAGKAFLAMVNAQYAAGQTPSEKTLRLLASSQSQSGDDEGYAKTIERLAVGYPKGEHGREYWTDVIQRASHVEKLGDRVFVDVYRLKAAALGQVADSERLSYASLAYRAGFPSEAKRLLDDGIARKAFAGSDAGEAAKLQAPVNKAAAQDKAQSAANESAARSAPNGEPLVSLGLLAALDGNAAHGVELIQAGIAKGGLKAPAEARLHLGVAQYLAGSPADAAKSFDAVGTTGGIGALSHAWSLLAQSQARPAPAPVAAAASK